MKNDNFAYIIIIALLFMNLVVTAVLCGEIKSLRAEMESHTTIIENVVEEPVEAFTEVSGGIPVVAFDHAEVDLPEYHKEAEWPRLYTDMDAMALAKLVWGEGRGVPDNGIVSAKCQQAAIVWTVLNRFDDGQADSIVGVITAPTQFHGYSVDHPVEEEFLDLAYDVLDRWNREKHDEVNVGRVIPNDYFWFRGDGTYNHFRNEYRSSETWGWELSDPYGV